MMRGIPVLLLAAACFSIPPYDPPNAVAFTAEMDGGALVAGDGFELHFAGGTGFHFPDSLKIAGADPVPGDVIGHEQTSTCFAEDEVGIRISPTPRISAHGPAMVDKSTLDAVMRGPAIVQVKVDWATKFKCEPDRNPGGTSTFTVFPDGRIVRHDQLADPAAAGRDLTSPFGCSCFWDDQGPGEDHFFSVSTYWAFARDRFTNIATSVEPSLRALPTSGAVDTNRLTACLVGNGYQVAFAWRDPKNDSTSYTTIRGGSEIVGLGYDLDHTGSNLKSLDYNFTTTLLLERNSTDCKMALMHATGYMQATLQALTINGKDMTPAPVDGIYGGDDGVQPPGIDVSNGRAEITGKVNGSFAVWLRFPRSVDIVRAKRSTAATGRWYLPQKVDGRSWIVWFRDPLAGETITVEPG